VKLNYKETKQGIRKKFSRALQFLKQARLFYFLQKFIKEGFSFFENGLELVFVVDFGQIQEHVETSTRLIIVVLSILRSYKR
jgi:hypothetical protein